jgi:hypothetical protein
MFRIGSALFIPSYLTVTLYRVFASPDDEGNPLIMGLLALSTAVRFAGNTFGYTAINILLNYSTSVIDVGERALNQNSVSARASAAVERPRAEHRLAYAFRWAHRRRRDLVLEREWKPGRLPARLCDLRGHLRIGNRAHVLH